MDDAPLPLADDFAPATREDWLKLVGKTLEGGDFNQRLVGHTIDGDVEWREVPDYPRYHWAYLDGRRVVVDDSHRVVEVY